MTAENRFYALALGQAFLVAVLAGVLASLTHLTPGFTGLEAAASDPAAHLSSDLVSGFLLVVVVLYLVLPPVTTWYLVRHGERDPLVYGVFGALALVGLPLLPVAYVTVDIYWDANAVLGVLGWVGVLALLALGYRHGRAREGADVEARFPAVQFLNVALVGVVLAGTVAGVVAAAPLMGPFVEDRRFGAPQATFTYEYEPAGDGTGVLTITHDGGDAIGAANLYIFGKGVTRVSGADQTSVGPWRGETTRVEWRDDPVVEPGDSVNVGVESDCRVRVVDDPSLTVLALADCEKVRAERGAGS